MISEARAREIEELVDGLSSLYKSEFGKVHFSEIVRHHGIRSAYIELPNPGIAAVHTDGTYSVLLNLGYHSDSAVRPSCPEAFTAFHELGHIFLGHLERGIGNLATGNRVQRALYNVREKEADVFARRFLENGAVVWTKPLSIWPFD